MSRFKTEIEVTFRVIVDAGAQLTDREAFTIDNLIGLVKQVKDTAHAGRSLAEGAPRQAFPVGTLLFPRTCACGKEVTSMRMWGQHKRRCQAARRLGDLRVIGASPVVQVAAAPPEAV